MIIFFVVVENDTTNRKLFRLGIRNSIMDHLDDKKKG
jgi:hypothetical protein